MTQRSPWVRLTAGQDATLTVRNRALAFRHVGLQYWAVERRGRKCSPHWLHAMSVMLT